MPGKSDYEILVNRVEQQQALIDQLLTRLDAMDAVWPDIEGEHNGTN